MDDSPMKLQSLASKSICIRLLYEWAEDEIPVINVWRRGRGYTACSARDWFLWQLCEMQVPHRFAHIPDKIQHQIEDDMALILELVIKWILHHHLLNVFYDDQPSSSLSEYIVKLVWNHRFKIDNLATAKNILTNDNLTALERFTIASTYCIVDEIEKFRDTMDSVPEWDSIGQIYVGYWTRYLKNKLDTIDVPRNSSIESFYLKAAEEHELWSAAVYFFDKLNPAKKSAEFERMLDFAETNLKDLLAKLGEDKEWPGYRVSFRDFENYPGNRPVWYRGPSTISLEAVRT
ncbi:uncharacterized protein LOC135834574 [Planococcus citri]|uniref:uncharacterized protein LOC135834574 n=1 Tax=Planococcus citri TaxID=170843 RepID=UPI0031F9A2FD